MTASLILMPFGCHIFDIEPEPEISTDIPLSYGHFVWLLMKELQPDLRFSDPVHQAMTIASEQGYIPLIQDPHAPITREETAQILIRVEESANPLDPNHYEWQLFDLANADYRCQADLLAAYARGLLDTEAGWIRPKEHLYLKDARPILGRLTNPEQRTLPPDLPAPYFVYQGQVEVTALDPSIIIDLKYATPDNFTGVVHYDHPLCLLEADTAQKLADANRSFQKEGYTIKIWDGYRPVAVQWSLYYAAPEHLKAYVPAPSRYSQHAKGIAVDITLVDENLQEVPMPTGFDDFSEKAHPDDPNASPATKRNRDILIAGMQKFGFQVSRLEW